MCNVCVCLRVICFSSRCSVRNQSTNYTQFTKLIICIALNKCKWGWYIHFNANSKTRWKKNESEREREERVNLNFLQHFFDVRCHEQKIEMKTSLLSIRMCEIFHSFSFFPQLLSVRDIDFNGLKKPKTASYY